MRPDSGAHRTINYKTHINLLYQTKLRGLMLVNRLGAGQILNQHTYLLKSGACSGGFLGCPETPFQVRKKYFSLYEPAGVYYMATLPCTVLNVMNDHDQAWF